MPSSKSYLELSEKEIAKIAKLTPKEQAAVDAFVAAAKALPRGILVAVEDYGDNQDGLRISKRITNGAAQEVAKVVKPSLIF